MDLVEIGESSEFLRKIADTPDRSDISIHRVYRLKCNDLGTARFCLSQQCLEMVEIIMPKDLLIGSARPDAGYHRGMVLLVRQDQAIRQQPADGAKRRLVGDITGGEGERGLLSMQVGELRLE